MNSNKKEVAFFFWVVCSKRPGFTDRTRLIMNSWSGLSIYQKAAERADARERFEFTHRRKCNCGELSEPILEVVFAGEPTNFLERYEEAISREAAEIIWKKRTKEMSEPTKKPQIRSIRFVGSCPQNWRRVTEPIRPLNNNAESTIRMNKELAIEIIERTHVRKCNCGELPTVKVEVKRDSDWEDFLFEL